ncbi:bacteriocin [Duganella sp. FT135W]|uniref:Bacteriocin n=2 Tax=Duganella flavida TaxID=2692175 RepID=A0A6L8KBF5_9BURK|nr:bacteriocin [Duganella flavida]
MKRALLPLMLLVGAAQAMAGELKPLDDKELSQVSGGDGISFAAHVVLNDPTLVGAVADSRLSLGFAGDGQNRYIVFKNVRGTVDMFAVNLGVQTRTDGGGDYIAIGLPGYVHYTNLGFESLSVQTDPTAPVTNSLGSLNINGTVSLQGQVRFWGH